MDEEAIQDTWPEVGTHCWGCGKNNEHGLHLQSYWEDEETVATWQPNEHHLAFPGILNGGIIATLMDCHATGTANAAAHKMAPGSKEHVMYVTASIHVELLRPTPLDKPVHLRARVKEISGPRISVTCSLFSGDVKCATREIIAVRVDVDKFLDKKSAV